MDFVKARNIAVLLGGTSREREISIRSGKRVAESLRQLGYTVFEIDPKERDLIQALRENEADVAFIMLHGKPGEDGTVQEVLEKHRIPYTGSDSRASAICIDKVKAKVELLRAKLPTPGYFVLDGESPKIPPALQFPLIVKPLDEGSSFGVQIAENDQELSRIAHETIQQFGNGFVEQYIDGKEITIGILGTGEKSIALPILELRPKSGFYDFKAKYTEGMTEFILPAELSKELYQRSQDIALAAYRLVGCRGFGRVDMMVAEDGTPYITEINTIPGMTDLSDLPAEAACAGISFDELVLKILQSAWE